LQRRLRAGAIQRGEGWDAGPVEERTRVGLAVSRDVGVSARAGDRIGSLERGYQHGKRGVLGGLERSEIGAFELDADGKSLQRERPANDEAPACQARCAQETNCVSAPGALDQKVSRHPHADELLKERVAFSQRFVGEQALDVAGAKATRGQTDVVNHQQISRNAGRPLIEVG
jgi:hypothetical protein